MAANRAGSMVRRVEYPLRCDMNGSDKADRVVMLRFASGPRVDIVADMTEPAAIADFAGRALAAEFPPSLPLIEAHTAAIPRERLLALLNGGETAVAASANPPRPMVSAAGVVQAVRAYMAALGAVDRSTEKSERAKEDFIEFFSRYGVDLDFTVARIRPPMSASEEWTKP